jgi:superfamily II DNA or RNA helicase
VSDIDPVLVDSLKALDPKRPIREADILGLTATPSRLLKNWFGEAVGV